MATPRQNPRPQPLRIAFAVGLGLIFTLLMIDSARAERTTVASHRFVSAHPDSAAFIDAGQLPTSQTITLTLRPASTPAQAADLKALLADQVNPASPVSHQWLTPGQFAARFGIAPLIAGISGLDNLPSTATMTLTAASPASPVVRPRPSPSTPSATPTSTRSRSNSHSSLPASPQHFPATAV